MMIPFYQEAAAAVQQALQHAHDGELDGAATGAISVLAGMLGRMFIPLIPKVGDDEKGQRLLVMFVSALALGLYCREANILIIGHGFTIVSSFCVVALATLGMFNITDPENFTKENMRSVASAATLGMVKQPPSPPPPAPPSTRGGSGG